MPKNTDQKNHRAPASVLMTFKSDSHKPYFYMGNFVIRVQLSAVYNIKYQNILGRN